MLSMIEKYGEEIGIMKWDQYREKQRYTNGVEYFIDKYGTAEGPLKWEELNKEKAKATSIPHIAEKYNVTFDEATAILSSRMSRNFVSEGEKIFIEQLERLITGISYTYKNGQFCIWNNYTHSPMFYDIVGVSNQKIIEYNGDYWHMNPAIYNESVIMKQTGKTAAEIRERDRLKRISAEERGFSLYVVWEREYQSNPDAVLNDVKKWWEQ